MTGIGSGVGMVDLSLSRRGPTLLKKSDDEQRPSNIDSRKRGEIAILIQETPRPDPIAKGLSIIK
jgi:hypothetical protein